ncbi:hypothetical protein MJT46_012128 [Ovis ammon polii x Ovis aries]|nr:hypothetical protein MJT46_012128 [Ovis ammon polii x Ovis aries]
MSLRTCSWSAAPVISMHVRTRGLHNVQVSLAWKPSGGGSALQKHQSKPPSEEDTWHSKGSRSVLGNDRALKRYYGKGCSVGDHTAASEFGLTSIDDLLLLQDHTQGPPRSDLPRFLSVSVPAESRPPASPTLHLQPQGPSQATSNAASAWLHTCSSPPSTLPEPDPRGKTSMALPDPATERGRPLPMAPLGLICTLKVIPYSPAEPVIQGERTNSKNNLENKPTFSRAAAPMWVLRGCLLRTRTGPALARQACVLPPRLIAAPRPLHPGCDLPPRLLCVLALSEPSLRLQLLCDTEESSAGSACKHFRPLT